MTWRAHVLSSGAENSQLPGTVSQRDVRSSDLSKELTQTAFLCELLESLNVSKESNVRKAVLWEIKY